MTASPISIADTVMILEEVDSREIATDPNTRQVFAQILEHQDDQQKKEALLTEALILLHHLPCVRMVNTQQEIETATVHRIMKRCLKHLFIELHFADVDEMPTETLTEGFGRLFGDLADQMKSELLHAFRASGRKLIHTKKTRSQPRSKSRATPEPMSVHLDATFFEELDEEAEPYAVGEPMKIKMLRALAF